VQLTTWILAGGIIGWMGFLFLNFNAKRGLLVSIIIGIAGGLLGGELLAPMFGSPPVGSGELNPLALFIALASALGCVTITDMIYSRFGV
jgi:uncharacterized membrane protein YeaQ/YmgE (transglycosylase-associated protein family)